ncbi:MAG: hypothetical protein H6585_14440 [Flavobacteriales bacterium]|nr:hypothetical protein [Flavobacteriales bacterium]MCB9449528.1 hypothetical protein [Flavobacteriales bacterium]
MLKYTRLTLLSFMLLGLQTSVAQDNHTLTFTVREPTVLTGLFRATDLSEDGGSQRYLRLFENADVIYFTSFENPIVLEAAIIKDYKSANVYRGMYVIEGDSMHCTLEKSQFDLPISFHGKIDGDTLNMREVYIKEGSHVYDRSYFDIVQDGIRVKKSVFIRVYMDAELDETDSRK